MRTPRTAFLAAVLVVLGVFSLQALSQRDKQPPPKIAVDPPKLTTPADAAGWKEVERLDGEQKYEAALVEVDKILAAAEAAGDESDWTKALVTRVQFRTALHGYETAVRELREAKWPDGRLARTTLELFYARVLVNYIQAYGWEIGQRERVEAKGPVDLKSWTKDQIAQEATAAFTRVWAAREALGEEPVAILGDYVRPNSYPAHIRGRLRDAATYLFVELLADSSLWRPEEANEIYRLDLAALLVEGLANAPKPDDAATHPLLRAVAVLDDLERWHQRAGRAEAAFETRLERLRRLHATFTAEDERARITADLEQRLPALRDLEWWAMGQATLAEMVRERPDPWTLVAARRIALEAAKAYPNSIGGQRGTHIAATIAAPDYRIQAMTSDGVRRRSIEISHRNLDALYFRAYHLDLERFVRRSKDWNLLPDYSEMTETIRGTGRPAAEWSVALPPTPDFRDHRTFTTPPLDAPGLYLIAASARADFSESGNRIVAANLIVTDLVLITRQLEGTIEVTVTSGSSGRPAAGVRVDLYQADWQKGHRSIANKATGGDGLVRFPYDPNHTNYLFLMARQGSDIAIDPQHLYSIPDQRASESSSALIYTDRSVYRPGQKLFWKAVAYRGGGESGRFEVSPSQPIEISLVDANNQQVVAKATSTNTYGSASGEFVIPAGRLLGQWYLRSNWGGQAPVRVEEYKRPTFEVALKDPTAPLRLNRGAKLVGDARYYFGLPVAGGEAKWRVERQPVYDWYWHWCSHWWGWRVPSVAAQTIAAGRSPIAADGGFEIAFTPEADQKAGRDTTWNYLVSVDVTDDGGETRSTSRSFRLGFVAVEASLSAERAFFVAGRSRPPEAKGDFLVRRTDRSGIGRKGEARWTLRSLEQPAATPTPAETPIPEPPKGAGKAPHRTPGDALRPRWEGLDSIEATLRAWKDDREIAAGKLTHDDHGEAWLPLPRLDAGAYRIRYTTKDDFGADYETTKEFLVTGTDGQTPALPLVALVESPAVEVGGTARLWVGSGLTDQPLILDLYRGGRRISRRELRRPELIEIPVLEKDRGGFGITVTAVRDHQFFSTTQSVFVPWDQKELDVSFATFRDRLRPGQKETWRVTVKGKTAPLTGAAELLAYMYDRSLDLFAPHNPPSALSLYPNWTGVAWARANLGSSSANHLFESGFASVPGYPTLLGDELILPSGYGVGGMGQRGLMALGYISGRARSDLRMEEGAVAKQSSRNQPLPASAPARAMEADAKEKKANAKDEVASKSDAGAAEPAPLRSNFSETAFWQPHLITAADGSAAIEFEVPDSVTSWKVFVHAITRDLRAGSIERETKTVKELMVRPYLPRFLREGDEAALEIVINNAGEKALSGELQFEIFDPETNESLAKAFGIAPQHMRQRFTVTAGGGTNLRVPLKAPARVGAAAVKVTARAGDFADGELRPLPLLPGRMHLMQSRFVTLKDKDRRELRFEDMAKSDDPSRIDEQMVVTIDAQLFYSVLQALPYLVDYPYECTEQTLNRFLSTGIVSSVFERYPSVATMAKEMAKRETQFESFADADPNRKLALEESPWLVEAKGGREDASHLIKVLDPKMAKATRASALAKLTKAQTSLGAWPWWEGGPPSPWMTLYIVSGFAKAREFQVEVPKEPIVRAFGYLHRHYLDECVKNMMAHDCCWEFITFLNYVLSSFPDTSWTGGVFTEAEPKTMLDFSFRHWKAHSPLLKGYLALTLKRAGRGKDATLVFDSVMDSAKTDRDLGTYWAPEDRGWLWYNDTVESHAFALRTLMELSPKDPRSDGMVQWLLLEKKLSHWKSTRATAEAIYSLVHYLEKAGALGIPEDATVTIGAQKVTFAFDPAKYTGKKNQVVVSGDKLDPATMSTVVVEKQSKGFAFASATWHFSTEKLPEKGSGDLFSVERRYFLREKAGSEWVLRPLAEGAKLAPGDQVEVQLSIRARHAAEYVHLRDPRGAGFEPDSQTSRFKWDLGLGYYEEIRDSGTNFFFEWLPAGEYTFKYRLRSAMAGNFRIGPATLQSIYAPEFAAYSAGARITIGSAKK